jgi:ribosomal protein L23
LARQARAQIKKRAEETEGKIEKFDLLQGTIFIDVDSDATAKTIKEMFQNFDGVKVETVEPLQAIYAKGRLKLAETLAA